MIIRLISSFGYRNGNKSFNYRYIWLILATTKITAYFRFLYLIPFSVPCLLIYLINYFSKSSSMKIKEYIFSKTSSPYILANTSSGLDD